ncbi:hypothetical protein RFM26_04365 [Mesorhizobium sp. VK23B]|uniref:Peptidase M48, Ste24p n=1 Tax=Mesorhizobium dulcispinae TaxID=3072316 RepID=A0ABU4XH56_9HYPH|nr:MULTISPECIES: hypothetical protein [unclassified Mesorhizobium]MDX8464914.1 hypothetical protein [Mesorhizobium sp. VK23B]MDX8472869.1 hypothetical protein [Mesorhizobium sp. VK23A]
MRIALSVLAIVCTAGLSGTTNAAEQHCPIAPEKRPATLPAAAANQILFYSDWDRAYAFLESKQDIAFGDNPAIHRWTDSSEDRAKLRQALEQLDKRTTGGQGEERSYGRLYQGLLVELGRGMPTRYEDPNIIPLLCEAAFTVQMIVARDSPSFTMPYLGTLPSGTLNATTFGVPGSSAKLVVVNYALFSFAHEFGKIGLATIKIEARDGNIAIEPSDEYFNRLRSDPAFLTRTSMALEDFASERPIVGHALPRQYDDTLLGVMDSALEQFAVAHEFAHIALHHTSQDSGPLQGIGEVGSRSDQMLRQSWGQEAVADLYAAAVVERISMREYHSASSGSLTGELGEFTRYAPVLFFQLNQIAEEARFVHDHKVLPPRFSDADRTLVLGFLQDALTDQAKTHDRAPLASISPTARPIPDVVRQFGDHPPAWARRALVQAYWQDHAPTPKDEVEVAFGALAIRMGDNLETLWSDIAPLWVEIVNKGPQK